MKRLLYMLFLPIFLLATIVLSSSLTFASLQGTWNAKVVIRELGDPVVVSKEIPVVICQYDEVAEDEPFLFVITDDVEDPFFGFVRDKVFSFFKNNQHGEDNLGREIIIGEVNKKEDLLQGTGTGFDSNENWGGSWSEVLFSAEKISDDTPEEGDFSCPDEIPWPCFYLENCE